MSKQEKTPATPPEAPPGGDPVAYNLVIPVVLVAIANGMHSPFTALMAKLSPAWYPPFLPPMPELVFYFASLLVSTLTLIVAGIPAALFERVAGTGRSTFVSMGIWLFAAAALTLPALPAISRLLSG